MSITAGKIFYLILICFFCFSPIFAQQAEVDSLSVQFRLLKEDTARVDVLNEIAFNYIHINPQIAKDDVNISLDLSKKISYSNGIARSYTVLGGINWSTGNYAEALNMYFKALSHYEKMNDYLGISRCYNNIGEVYKRTGDLAKSLEYHNKSLKIKDRLKLPSYMTYINIAEVYVQMNRFEEAKTYYNIVIDNKNDVPPKYLAYAYAGKGQIELQKGNFILSKEYFGQALNIRKKSNDQRGLADIYYKKSIVFKNINMLDSADYFSKLAISISKNIGARDILANSYLNLAYIDSLDNNYHSAFRNYMFYSRIKDSVLNEEKLTQIARLQTEYETELLKKENEANVVKVKQQNTLIIGIILLMFFSIAIAWTFYRQQDNQQRVNFLLASKNEEISRQNNEIQQQALKLKHLNAQLEKLNEGLENKVRERTQILIEQNKKLAEYAYTNAHELRAPVANILGLSNLLTYSSDLTVKEQDLVKHLQKATAELDQVIGNIRKKLEDENNVNNMNAASDLPADQISHLD